MLEQRLLDLFSLALRQGMIGQPVEHTWTLQQQETIAEADRLGKRLPGQTHPADIARDVESFVCENDHGVLVAERRLAEVRACLPFVTPRLEDQIAAANTDRQRQPG